MYNVEAKSFDFKDNLANPGQLSKNSLKRENIKIILGILGKASQPLSTRRDNHFMET